MTMLDRYLSAVKTNLPKDEKASDIAAEIADALQSQMEEREAVLGRPLTEDERAEIIKAYGHPQVVAARYGRVQYLIGPELLPFYWSTLRLVATIIVAIELIAGAISALVSKDGTLFFNALAAAWNSLIWIFGIVTVVFIAGERVPSPGNSGLAGSLMKWDPRRLPALGALPPVPRTSSLAEFIANFIALLVLIDASGEHRIPLDIVIANALHGLNAALTPAWHAAYLGAIVGTSLLVLSSVAVFVRPQLAAFHECVRVVSSIAVIMGLVLTLQAGPWIRPAPGPLNTAALYFLCGGILVLALQIALSARNLRRLRPVLTL